MSQGSKWLVVAVVLAIVLPMAVVVIRRLIRGRHLDHGGKGTLPPPAGPDLGGGPGP